jgi:hypothetical protein
MFALVGGLGIVLVAKPRITNDAAESACCKVVAAEELNLLLRFGECGSHNV